MKVLALNSSPRSGGQSKTELMLNHLVQMAMEGKYQVEGDAELLLKWNTFFGRS
ncbi:MAG: NAD(P)H-dependent oxidoreductase [Proteobacteria bacterium]|nr:NAD(P)H-dependent oxidoreductase [Pseudomonadota bacterium]